jgi:hypothetical protein
MKRLIPALLIALLVPVASAAAAPGEPSAALSHSWLGEKAACTVGDMASGLNDEGAQPALVLPDAPFAQPQDKGGFCPPGACDDFCIEQCGGFPFGQCIQHRDGVCRAICCCPPGQAPNCSIS